MRNTELLQEAYNLASVYLDSSAVQLILAVKELERANKQCNDIRTWERIRDLRIRHADMDCFVKQMLAVQFVEKPEDKNKQCYNCGGKGKVQAYFSEITCPVCNGSGTLTT